MSDHVVKIGGNASLLTDRRAPFKTWLYMIGLLLILFSATLLPPIAVALR